MRRTMILGLVLGLVAFLSCRPEEKSVDPADGQLATGHRAVLAQGSVLADMDTGQTWLLWPGDEATVGDDPGPEKDMKGEPGNRLVRVTINSGRSANQSGSVIRGHIRPMPAR